MLHEWIFELKLEGFRALAVIEHGRARLLSRNGHSFASFAELGICITGAISNIGRVGSEWQGRLVLESKQNSLMIDRKMETCANMGASA